VKDIDTGLVISGATISTGTVSTTSNSTGNYTLNVGAGSYTLTATASGHVSTKQTCTVTTGASATVNWSLIKSYGSVTAPGSNMSYKILAANDLGMHCDQDDYSYFLILPPANTLKVQVIGSSGSPVTSGITVSYAFPKKANPSLHTNFWTYASKYGYNVATNAGISGTLMSGNMKVDSKNLGFVAEAIPVTPYDDDGTWDPYGTATVTVKNSSTGAVLQTASVVVPVSTEMHCNNCHNAANPQLDILQKHDTLSGTRLVADQASGILHKCNECHADNILGAAGKAGVESLSLAMHNCHKDKLALAPDDGLGGCYNCHPGAKTQCLRGIMSKAGLKCKDCHGEVTNVAATISAGRQPWLQEPQCGGCHGSKNIENSGTLFHNSVLTNSPTSKMNNKYYCISCHNGPHAEYVTSNVADAVIPKQIQGDNYWLWNCNICHSGSGTMHR
jgi:hypothetical protein